MDCFTLENLSFSYPGQTKKALDGISLSVKQGSFLLLCGSSGCGKTTLLRHMKTVLTPCGDRTGEIYFEDKPLSSVNERTQAEKIGYVLQSPENQVVTDKVWHELAFGLESLGCDTPTIRRRVAETASFFGIESWFHKSVCELSGGQKQLLSLAAVMVMQPSVLISDEPTAQLDPIAASGFLSALAKINRELGTTVVLTEHRLEEAFTHATEVAVMESGGLLCCDTPQNVGAALREKGHGMFRAMPAAVRVWAGLDSSIACPVTVRDGKSFLSEYAEKVPPVPAAKKRTVLSEEVVLECRNAWFRYEKDQADVLRGFDFTLHRGEFYALLGGNGAGKTTALKVLCGLRAPYRGRVVSRGKLGVLPQDPQALFIGESVREDLLDVLRGKKAEKEETEQSVIRAAAVCRISELLDRHPFDLSGGEMQRAALAKVLLTEPDILLLDEPTKGFDAELKVIFADVLRRLLSGGTSIFAVSHDAEFCAEYADRCGLFFDGSIVASGTPEEFFSGNSFYTTSANRMARHILPAAVTTGDILAAFGRGEDTYSDKNGETPPPLKTCEAPANPSPLPPKSHLDRRALLAAALILLCIPLTLALGILYFKGSYGLISILILLECMLPFFLVFEGRKPRARELVIIAVLCAVGVAGRAAFFMLPQFKPVMALTIIAGVAFGGETGFIVGSTTMLASNMMFSQGPWTPWQMFCMGITGFFAGVLFKRGRLRRGRITLAAFGAFSAVVIYGGIMNPASVLMWSGSSLSWKTLLAAYVAGLPADLVHAFATAFFLLVAAVPMLKKLDRVKTKFGLL